MSSDASLWDDVARSWKTSRGTSAVRSYSDLVNRALLERWLPARAGSALKTDLFDEIAGEGLVASIAERAERMVGIDVSPAVVQTAVSRNPGLEGIVADVHALPFEPESFDLVVSNSTLDHFESRHEIDVALGEFARVLRPGGTLVVTLDNGANPVVRFRNRLPGGLLRRLGLVPYPVGVTLGPDELLGAVERAGLVVEDARVVAHVPRLLVRATGSQSPRLLAAERLAGWPTRSLTGQFVAIRARAVPGRDGAHGRDAVGRRRGVPARVAALVERALSATVLRRLTLLELVLDERRPVEEPAVALSFGFLGPGEAQDLERLRPGLGAAARDRFAHGERCFAARSADGALASVRWVATGRARIEFLGCSLRLRDGEAYNFDTWTQPSFRGVGAASAAGARLADALAAEGIHAILRAVWPANAGGLRNAGREGFVPVGSLVAIRLGPFRRFRRRHGAP